MVQVKVRLDLAYDGTGFRGWARQRGGVRTVEGELLRVLGQVCDEPVKLSAAGRTDAGVHARQQVVSFDATLQPSVLQGAVNGLLGPEVVVWTARRVRDGFDARHSASAREYTYRVSLAPVADPFTSRFVLHRPLDYRLGPMRRAAGALTGEHDFTSFCRPDPDRTTVRTIQRLTISRAGEDLEFTVRADGFLRQMVRSLVGTLLDVGRGHIDPDSMQEILDAGDRSAAGEAAPAHGLTLERVLYDRRTTKG